MSEQEHKSQAVLKRERVIKEFKEAVTSEQDFIGLMGHQPSLVKIRKAYRADQLTDEDLDLVLTSLYTQHKGEQEPFKSKKHMVQVMFGDLSIKTKSTPKSNQEQIDAIAGILEDTKKPKRSKTKKPKPAPTINIDALPANLRYLIK